MVAAPPAASRHPNRSLALLPSGPGGRGDALTRCVEAHRVRRRAPAQGCAGRKAFHGWLLEITRLTSLKEQTRKWWRLRQPHPGTRIIHYRCCLPALAEFANYRRGRTNGATVETSEDWISPFKQFCKIWRRERDSNPRSGYKPLTHFPGVLLQPLGHLSVNFPA